MLGDTAVAVHPEDDRYKHLHGKFLIHPFNGRRIPMITDAELVDMEFGTGAVKITPAHDPNDYECGKRHNLEFITVLSPDGAINGNGSQFEGMMRYDARIAVEKALQEKELFVGKEPNKMRLGVRCRGTNVPFDVVFKPTTLVDPIESDLVRVGNEQNPPGISRLGGEMGVVTWSLHVLRAQDAILGSWEQTCW